MHFLGNYLNICSCSKFFDVCFYIDKIYVTFFPINIIIYYYYMKLNRLVYITTYCIHNGNQITISFFEKLEIYNSDLSIDIIYIYIYLYIYSYVFNPLTPNSTFIIYIYIYNYI